MQALREVQRGQVDLAVRAPHFPGDQQAIAPFDALQAFRQRARQPVAFQLLPEPRDRALFRGQAMADEGGEVFSDIEQFRVRGHAGFAPVLGEGWRGGYAR